MDRISKGFRGFGRAIRGLWRDESGAVTVDWVVLTSAIVGLGFLIITQFGASLLVVTTQVSDDIATRAIGAEY